jgi:adenylate cyclase
VCTTTQLSIIEQGHAVFRISLAGLLEVGRQRDGEPLPYQLLPATADSPQRLIIAPAQEKENVSRQHLLLEPLPSGSVRVLNRSQIPLEMVDRPSIAAGTGVELLPPFSLRFPPRALLVTREESVAVEASVEGLDQTTVGPGSLVAIPLIFRPPPALDPQKLNELVGWLQTAMGVLQASVGATDFLNQAAAALVKIVGLQSSRVLLIQNNSWCVAATQPPPAASLSWRPSTSVLGRLFREKRTCWQEQGQNAGPDSASLAAMQTVVAAPILDREGKVIGALYGERRKEVGGAAPSSGKLEAMLVELLACGIASGLARKEQEQKAVQSSALFEQFFTPELARSLAQTPDLLSGRKATVSVMFCDIRSFSSASEKLGPEKTFTWINDVMQDLSVCIREQEGVLVDYIGDELLAMWGAPEPSDDQAERATRAAVAMLAALGPLSSRWQARIGQAIRIGIGINTGIAHVGNTGSKLKFKYGPLGNTVNLASRVQGLTKYLKCPFLVTAATRKLLGREFIARRVVKTRVVNIEKPVDLFEVEIASSQDRNLFFEKTEEALGALEGGDYTLAARIAGEVLQKYRRDGPLLLILSRASAALVNDGLDFDPVWAPPGK